MRIGANNSPINKLFCYISLNYLLVELTFIKLITIIIQINLINYYHNDHQYSNIDYWKIDETLYR